MMFFWFIILGFLVYYLFKNDFTFAKNEKNSETILNERLAKGNITIQEYNEIKNTIKGESK